MHSNLHKPIDEMSFEELDALREKLRVPQALVCQMSDISPTTYLRWRRWARGGENGSEPRRRTMKAFREALKKRFPASAGSMPFSRRSF